MTELEIWGTEQSRSAAMPKPSPETAQIRVKGSWSESADVRGLRSNPGYSGDYSPVSQLPHRKAIVAAMASNLIRQWLSHPLSRPRVLVGHCFALWARERETVLK